MNNEYTESNIKALRAHSNGGNIEVKIRHDITIDDDWETCRNPSWDFNLFQYRVKGESVNYRAIVVDNTEGVMYLGFEPSTPALPSREMVNVREVL